MDFEPGEWEQALYIGKVAIVGWALHYRKWLFAPLRLCAHDWQFLSSSWAE